MGKKKKHKQHDLGERVAEGFHDGAHLGHALHAGASPHPSADGHLAHAATGAAVALAGGVAGAATVLVADDYVRAAAAKAARKAAKKARKKGAAAVEAAQDLWSRLRG